jgi:CheY-like chemotaxis protein
MFKPWLRPGLFFSSRSRDPYNIGEKAPRESPVYRFWRNMALDHCPFGTPRATFETPATPPVPSASAIHGIVGRKRTHVSSNSVPHVFVVDDEQVIASSLAAILKLHGYAATAFTSAREALAAAQSKAPDLLISDVLMPGLSGVDLAIQIRGECPECRILLFSGQATTQDLLKEARRQGNLFELLQKPVHPSALLESIESLTMKSVPRKAPGSVHALPVSPPVLGMPRRNGTHK